MSTRFELRIGNVVHRPAPPELMEAFRQAQVTEASGRPSGFQLSFWAGKGSRVTETMVARLFDPPARVLMSVVHDGHRHVLMDGIITRHEFAPSNEAGQSTLTLTGRDLTFLMDLIDVTGRPFPAAAPSVQAQVILASYTPFGVVAATVPDVVQLALNPLDKTLSQQGTDYQYLTQLAARSGFTFYVEPGPTAGVSVGYWGPELRIRSVQPALTVGSDAGTNVESLSFAFDGEAPTVPISFYFDEVTKRAVPVAVPDVSALKPPLGLAPPVPLRYVRDTIEAPRSPAPPVGEGRSDPGRADRPRAQARSLMGKHNASLAEKIAHQLAYSAVGSDAVTASGSLDVLRYGHVLRARRLVDVRGGSLRYDGTYFVKSVTHQVEPGGYTQSFELARKEFRPQKGSVTT